MTFDLDRIGGSRMLDALVDEVLAAGQDAMRLFRDAAKHRLADKNDRSPVTEADHAVERRLSRFVSTRIRGAAFLGEESGHHPGSEPLRFVVDPIDGTRAFLRGLSTWSILVGLEADGEPVLGIAYLPADEDLYVGVRGHGAYGNGRPLWVSDVETPAEALVCHGGLSQFSESRQASLLPMLAESTYTQRGFADFDGYRQVLLGHADAMVDPGIQAWDVCAAAVLVREAGGRFTSFSGEDTVYGGSALATNGRLHDAMLQLLDGVSG